MASRELKVEIIGDSRSLQKALGNATDTSSKFGSTLAKMGKLAAVGLGALGVGAVVAGKKMIDLASDAAEVQSKMEVIFGKELPQLTKNLDKFSEATGASKFALREQAANLGALLEPLVANKGAAADMSEQFVRLATDLGSFNNVPVEEALLAIRSGLVGEAEPLRRFGVLLNEAAVKAEAYSAGITKVGAELTEQEKVQARANLIMKQTTLAQGDATRTSDSMANQMKRLRNNVTDMATSLGQLLIPFALKAAQAFNENWPQIERVITSAMEAVVHGATIAAEAVQRHFGTIKAVAISAFGGAKSTIMALVNFFKSDFGTTLGTAILSVVAMKTAMGALGLSISGVGSALSLFVRHPAFALLLPLGLLVGELAGNFIKSKIAAQELASAMDRASGSARGLKDSLDTLKDAELSVKEARLGHKEATVRLAEAQAAYNKSVAESGAKSKESLQLHRDLAAAKLAEERAELTLEQSQKRATDAQTARNAKLREGEQALFKLTAEGARANATFAGSQTLDRYAESVRGIGRGAADTALKAKNMGDEAGSRAAAKVAHLADVAVDLTKKLGRVPERKEIVAEAKAQNFDKFYATLLEAQRKMKETAAVGAQAGSDTGSGFNTGLSGWIGTIAATAASLARNAERALRQELQAQSDSRVFIRAGEDTGSGYATGITKSEPKVTEATRKLIEKARAAVDAQRSSFSTAWEQFAADAMRAFDAQTEKGIREIQRKLALEIGKIEAQLEAALKKIEKQRGKLTPSERALQQMDEGIAREGREAALTSAQGAVAAATTPEELARAQQQLLDAQRAIAREALEEQAELERKAADEAAARAEERARKIAERETLAATTASARRELDYQAQREQMRRNHERFLQIQGELLAKHPGQWEAIHKKIMKKFKEEFGPDYELAGKELGHAFGVGLARGIGQVESGVKLLAEEIAKYLRLGSPTEKGPLSTLDQWAKPFAKTWASGLDTRGLVGSFSGGTGAVAMAGGGPPIVIHVHGSVLTEHDLVNTVQRAVIGKGRRSGYGLLGGYA